MSHYEFERRLIVGKKQSPHLDMKIGTFSGCKNVRPYTGVWINIYSTLPAPYNYKIYRDGNLIREGDIKQVIQWYPWHKPPSFKAGITIKPKRVGHYKVVVTKDTLTKEGEFEVYGPLRPIIRPPLTVYRPTMTIVNVGDLRGYECMYYSFYKGSKELESGKTKLVRYARFKVPGKLGDTIRYRFSLPYKCRETGRSEWSIIDGKIVLATLRDQLKPSETAKVSEKKFTFYVEGADDTNTIIEGTHKVTVVSHTTINAKYWRLYVFVSPFGGTPYSKCLAEGKGKINVEDILWNSDYKFNPSYTCLYLSIHTEV